MLPGHLARRLLAARSELAAQTLTELVFHVLEQALTLRQPAPELIIHANRGSQYTNMACRARIVQAGALVSFSGPGNPYNNAQAEARLKPSCCLTAPPLPRSKKPD